MRRFMRSAIPSMFHRRLALLLVVFALAMAALAARLVDLTIVEGNRRLAEAESRLIRRTWTPTVRGRILDRKGRVLAMDRPSYSVAVEYDVLSGQWARREGRRKARRVLGEAWLNADEDRRRQLETPFVERYRAHVSRMLDRVAEITRTDRADIDRRIERIIARVGSVRRAVAGHRLESMIERHLAGGRGLTDDDAARLENAAETPVAEERDAHVIVEDLPDETAFALRRLTTRRVPVFAESESGAGVDVYADLLPGVVVRDATERVRPFDRVDVAINRADLPGPMRGDGFETVRVSGLGWHTLGTLRTRIFREDNDHRRALIKTDPETRRAWTTEDGVDRGRYMPGDTVGQRGIERAKEDTLRGLRGIRTVRLDTGQEQTYEPVPGRDVTLTVDAMLEARIRAVLEPGVGLTTVQPWHGNHGVPEGETLAGAAVVIEIDTGQILAMVSTPSPAGDSRWIEDENPPSYPEYLDPYVNRAVGVPYPPGSIVKPLMLAEATRRGFYTLDDGIVCTGHLLPDRDDVYRCWIYKRYGLTHSPTGEPVRAAESIKVSCNIFYYTLGRRMGPEVVADVYHDLGVGEAFGVGGGWPGKVGPIEGPGDGTDLGISDAILMGMGQGPVTWTPLHAANAYAALARGGAWIDPKLIDDGTPALASRMLEFDPAAVSQALEGLRLSVNDPGGTGCTIRFGSGRERIFNTPGVDLWGKTGTAQAPDLRFDPDGDGPEPPRVVRSGDHAWFVLLAGPKGEGPRYAIAVLIEYGGGGGRVAGPVANQIVHALIDEGYLPGAASVASGGAP